MKAMKIYVKYVAYDSVDELRINSLHPTEVTRDQALLKYLLARGNEIETVGKLKENFDECEDNVLLVDSSLL